MACGIVAASLPLTDHAAPSVVPAAVGARVAAGARTVVLVAMPTHARRLSRAGARELRQRSLGTTQDRSSSSAPPTMNTAPTSPISPVMPSAWAAAKSDQDGST